MFHLPMIDLSTIFANFNEREPALRQVILDSGDQEEIANLYVQKEYSH